MLALKIQTHWTSEPEHDCFSEYVRREECFRASVVLGRDASPVLQTTEHDLNAFSCFVAALVVFHGLLARLPAWDAGFYPFVLKRFSQLVRIIAPVRQEPVSLRQAVQKRRRAGVIAYLSC